MDCIIEGASILDTVSKALNGGSAEESAGGVVGVRFVSPTDLHRQGKSAGAPDFHILVRNLLRRVSLLSLGHCGCRMELDFNEWIHRAEEVETVSVRSKRIEWERVSNRQDRRVPMGGFCGEIVYRGNIAPFLGLLLLGSLVHVGDNCAFGMGRYLVGLPGVPWMPWGWVFTGEGT